MKSLSKIEVTNLTRFFGLKNSSLFTLNKIYLEWLVYPKLRFDNLLEIK